MYSSKTHTFHIISENIPKRAKQSDNHDAHDTSQSCSLRKRRTPIWHYRELPILPERNEEEKKSMTPIEAMRVRIKRHLESLTSSARARRHFRRIFLYGEIPDCPPQQKCPLGHVVRRRGSSGTNVGRRGRVGEWLCAWGRRESLIQTGRKFGKLREPRHAAAWGYIQQIPRRELSRSVIVLLLDWPLIGKQLCSRMLLWRIVDKISGCKLV